MWLLFTTLKVSKESFGLNFFFWATNYGIFFSNFCKKLNEYHATEEEEPLSIWPRQLHYIRFRFKLSMLLLRYIRNTSAHIWNLFIKRRSLVKNLFFLTYCFNSGLLLTKSQFFTVRNPSNWDISSSSGSSSYLFSLVI